MAVVLGLLAAAAERHEASSPFVAWEPPAALLAKLAAAEEQMGKWVGSYRIATRRLGCAAAALGWRSMELVWCAAAAAG